MCTNYCVCLLVAERKSPAKANDGDDAVRVSLDEGGSLEFETYRAVHSGSYYGQVNVAMGHQRIKNLNQSTKRVW